MHGGKGIYLLWFKLRMWVLWGINSFIWNGGRCQSFSNKDWLMSKGSNGKERGGAAHLYLIPHLFLFLLKSVLLPLNLSFLLYICLHRCLTHFFLPPVLPSLCLLSPPPTSFSIPLFILTSLSRCVVMCNVLKLARSMADGCRYRLISHKSGCSDQLPHRGQRDRKTDTRQAWVSECICVSLCVDSTEVSTRCLTSQALLIQRWLITLTFNPSSFQFKY